MDVSVCPTDRSHDGWEAPLCAEESVAVQTSSFVQAALQNVHPDHIWVHRVRVLPHRCLDDRLPWVTAGKESKYFKKGGEMRAWVQLVFKGQTFSS